MRQWIQERPGGRVLLKNAFQSRPDEVFDSNAPILGG
jgi:hypothetical protein